MAGLPDGFFLGCRQTTISTELSKRKSPATSVRPAITPVFLPTNPQLAFGRSAWTCFSLLRAFLRLAGLHFYILRRHRVADRYFVADLHVTIDLRVSVTSQFPPVLSLLPRDH